MDGLLKYMYKRDKKGILVVTIPTLRYSRVARGPAFLQAVGQRELRPAMQLQRRAPLAVAIKKDP